MNDVSTLFAAVNCGISRGRSIWYPRAPVAPPFRRLDDNNDDDDDIDDDDDGD